MEGGAGIPGGSCVGGRGESQGCLVVSAELLMGWGRHGREGLWGWVTSNFALDDAKHCLVANMQWTLCRSLECRDVVLGSCH